MTTEQKKNVLYVFVKTIIVLLAPFRQFFKPRGMEAKREEPEAEPLPLIPADPLTDIMKADVALPSTPPTNE